MSYKKLDIYNLALELFLEVHPLSLKLPKYELYELGSQLRRSVDSVVSNIVEGYVRRRYQAGYLRFLIFAHSSNDETINHLLKLSSLYPELKIKFADLEERYNTLGAKINSFIRYIERNG